MAEKNLYVLVITLFGLSISLLPVAAQDKGDAAKKELARFQGTWTFVSMELDGKPMPKSDETRTITFEGDKFTVKLGSKVIQEGTQRLNPDRTPRTIDANVREGEGKGTQLGIYELKVDTMTACFDPQGKKRPTEFKSPAGSGYLLAVLKKNETIKKGIDPKDPSIVYDEPWKMGTGFKSYNGNAYDKAVLRIDPKFKLALPSRLAEVSKYDRADEVTIYMEKRMSFGFHVNYSVSIADKRHEMGCAVKLEKGEILIGTFGEFSFLEGACSMKLFVLVPPKVEVIRRAGLIGGYSGRAGTTRTPDMINPTREDPKPVLTRAMTKKGTDPIWVAPTVEDGWHEIPAVADRERRVGLVFRDKK